MKLIDADALLKKTINNPLHVPYITKKDVIDMPSALNNQVNLCDSCTYTYPECPSEKDDVIFGNGIGNDNICACNKYQPTVQPVATDTNVGDTISRQEARLCLTGDITNMTIEQYIKMVGERFDALTPSKPKVKEADWIPCSVRLPEGDEAVLANLTKEYVTWTRALLTPGSLVQYEYAKGVVDAWRPLPEEYKEGGERI